MFYKINILFFSIFLAVLFNASAQEIPIGTWQDHLSYKSSVAVTHGNGITYCASESALFSYNNDDGSIERLNLVSGLSDIEITNVKFNSYNNKLIVAYKNGNIDIIDANKKITNLNFIKNNSSISGSKSVNKILFNNNLAYLSTGFGIVVLNTDKNEVADTYLYGNLGAFINTNAVAFDNNYIYAATNNGVFFANKNSFNLADYNEWSQLSSLSNQKYSNIVNYNGTLVVSTDSPNWESDSAYYFNGTTWIKINNNGLNINKLETFNNKLLIVGSGVGIYNTNFIQEDVLYTHGGSFGIDAADVHLDENNTYWIADKNNGLLKQKDNWNVSQIIPDGPNSSASFALDVNEDALWVVSGGYEGYRMSNLFNIRKNYEWVQTPKNMYNPQNGNQIFNFVSVLSNPSNTSQVFIGAWDGGLLEFNNDVFTNLYNAQNSALDSTSSYRTAISGMAFDKNNNLWISSSYGDKTLAVKTTTNNWYNFKLDGTEFNKSEIKKVVVDRNDFVWVLDSKLNKTHILKHNNTFDDVSDDDKIILPINDSREITTFIEDLDGEMWFGSNQGVGVIYNPSNVFSGETIQPIYIQQDGQTQLLLESERITAIAVDGANRKWIGTQTSGVYLLSDDGTEEIFHFTKENSPLFSNNIYDIKINNKTGEVFFATEKGLLSYKSTATEAQDDFSNVFVYPNPVREDYHGVIAIRGLVKDTDVRITDISGNLVSQTKSLGGQAIWDGKDLNGNRVQTGVYMVFNASPEGELKKAAKILFIH
ncbi:MAG: hypothetical protein KFKLKKLM_02607 [Flavobacteriales bacterium]|nr:hypothetical protein [Flavobacteriales bacterium]